jgi:hypothetical protein
MVGKRKNRRRTAERFQNFTQLLRLLINVNRNVVHHRKGMEIATFLPIPGSRWAILLPLL